MTGLNLISFDNAISRLNEGFLRYQREAEDLQIRDGLIQGFEFTYEISYKMLKRYLVMTSASPELFNEMTFQDLIRSANEQGLLLGNWLDWKQYRDMRSRTSHTYDENIAVIVVGGIPKFLQEMQFLQQKLHER